MEKTQQSTYLKMALSMFCFIVLLSAGMPGNAFGKSFCICVWKPAATGNFAPKGGSLASADFRSSSGYSAQSGRDALAAWGQRGYVGMGPTDCLKIDRFKSWLSKNNRSISGQQLRDWNSWYNKTYW